MDQRKGRADETAYEVFSRFLRPCLSTGLPCLDDYIPKERKEPGGEIIEISGGVGSGKSEMLSSIIIFMILPRSWNNLFLGGNEVGVILIDNDMKFSLHKFSQLIKQKAYALLQSPSSMSTQILPASYDFEGLVNSCFERLFLIQPTTPLSYFVVSHSLSLYLSNTQPKMNSFHQTQQIPKQLFPVPNKDIVRMIAVDNANPSVNGLFSLSPIECASFSSVSSFSSFMPTALSQLHKLSVKHHLMFAYTLSNFGDRLTSEATEQMWSSTRHYSISLSHKPFSLLSSNSPTSTDSKEKKDLSEKETAVYGLVTQDRPASGTTPVSIFDAVINDSGFSVLSHTPL